MVYSRCSINGKAYPIYHHHHQACRILKLILRLLNIFSWLPKFKKLIVEDLYELVWSEPQKILPSEKSKVQKSVYGTLLLHIVKQGDLRKHTRVGSSVQRQQRKNEPETKETINLQGVGGKGLKRTERQEWNKTAGMRRVYTCLNPSVELWLLEPYWYSTYPKCQPWKTNCMCVLGQAGWGGLEMKYKQQQVNITVVQTNGSTSLEELGKKRSLRNSGKHLPGFYEAKGKETCLQTL